MRRSKLNELPAAAGLAAALLLLGACTEPLPAATDGGIAPDGVAFPGRCAALTCTVDGVCEEDAPTGVSRIGGIWGSGPSDVYVVGAEGLLVRFDGQKWTKINPGTTAALHDVWGSGPSDVFVVGVSGTVLRYDGVTWKAMASGTKASLRSVWGSGPTRVFAVGKGDTGSVGLRYDGTKWSEVTALAQHRVTLTDVTGVGEKRAVAVGYYYDGNKYNMAQQVACKLVSGAWTCSGPQAGGEVFAAWLMPAGGSYLVGTCCKDKLKCGGMIQTQGHDFCSPGTLDRAVQYHAVWGRGPSDIRIAGAGGILIHYEGTKEWFKQTSGTTTLLRALWGDQKDLLVGGNYGVLLRVCGK